MPTTAVIHLRVVSALTITAFALAMALGAGRAEAAVSCGDTIRKDTTLRNDLVNCRNNGIVIGADGVTLDLNGHTVDGDNELVKRCPGPCEDGIVTERHTGVTIENGVVREFGFGVFVVEGRGNRVQDMVATRNIFNGILVFGSTRSSVTASAVRANGLETDYPGIAVVESSHVTIERSTSTGNADLGIYAVESDHNAYVGNTLSANPEAGAIIEGDGNKIRHNRVTRNGDGLILAGNDNVVAGNQILRAKGCGEGCGTGISLEDGRGNRIVRNVIRRTRESGIRVKTYVGKQSLRDTLVRRNVVRDAGRNGILISGSATGSVLQRNHIRRAGEDGIHLKTPAVLTRNHANRNSDLGIAAVPGTIDGGGNIASGNGNSLQCSFVLCQ